jgi:hypothetical protein
MNNPFSRLKHHGVRENNPQENHATESLAACLVFSESLRRIFIQFLFREQPDSMPDDLSGVEIETQQWEQGVGYFDLVLKRPNVFTIIVEVKVEAAEDDGQLKKYRSWLDKQAGRTRLFTLVKNFNTDFNPKDFGADGRHTWRELHGCFQKALKNDGLSDVEISLIENFSDYLESEGIVSTYKTKDMQCYSAGLNAQKAVASILGQVGGKLKADGYEHVLIDGNQFRWPQLKIKHPGWNSVFGNGDNYKVVFWFTVPAIVGWGADKHTFYPELCLWNADHGNDWPRAKANLSKWATKLEVELGFTIWIQDHWNRTPTPIAAGGTGGLASAPWRIFACRDKDIINAEGDSVPGESELVARLLEQAKGYSKIILSLADR